jgi:hypothetical protein
LVPGFEIGFVKAGKHFLRSNLQFSVLLRPAGDSFFVARFDLTGANSNSKSTCFVSRPDDVAIEDSKSIPFTFSVGFNSVNATNAVRGARFQFINVQGRNRVLVTSASCIVLSGIAILLVLYRAIWKDGQRIAADFDEYEGYEWKLIHGDVFRPPRGVGSLKPPVNHSHTGRPVCSLAANRSSASSQKARTTERSR